MKFSIVTVCFNAEAHVAGAMNSLASQTFRDFEWVVVDGGSKDRTLDIVRSRPELPTRILSEPDKGIYDAMNKGIALARGEYVFFLNADDCFADGDVLSRIAADLDGSTRPDILVGRIWHSIGDRRILRDFSHLSYRRLLIDSICHQATFCRRELLQASGGFDLRYRMCADYDWFLRVLRRGATLRFIDHVVALFAGDGAHARQAEVTGREVVQIRHEYLSGPKYWLFTAWRYLDHYGRRLRRLAPRGYVRVETSQ